MSENPQSRAVEELEQFGLREYEAKCFVALTKITAGTARDVSEHIDVPRTRVYEAVRSLESQGLVEIQHSSPQRFQAIPVPEAIEVLNDQYRARIDSLERSLEQIERAETDSLDTQAEVWSLTGASTITTRATRLVDEAETELLLLVGSQRVISSEFTEQITTAHERGINVVAAGPEAVRPRLREQLPAGTVSDANMEWLHRQNSPENLSVGRLLLIDDQQLLASTVAPTETGLDERAVLGRGTCNGLIFVVRQFVGDQLGIRRNGQG